jgi:hypothetical protein
MKNICIILILITALSCRDKKFTSDLKDLTLNISLLKAYYLPYKGQINYETANDSITEKIFHVRTSLINNSDKEYSLWMMKCSWWNNFMINNYYINFADSIGCDGNFPIQISLRTHDSIIFNTRLSRDIQVDNPCKNCIGFFGNEVKATRLGFIVIESDTCPDYHQYFEILHDRSRWDKIIWSNPLYLLR